MKNKENQILSTASIVSMLALVGACFLVLAPIFNQYAESGKAKALKKAQALAYQVVAIQMNQERKGSREPASVRETSEVNQMGTDPWGQPYHYQLFRDDMGIRVDVWSTGPNAVRTSVRIPKEGY